MLVLGYGGSPALHWAGSELTACTLLQQYALIQSNFSIFAFWMIFSILDLILSKATTEPCGDTAKMWIHPGLMFLANISSTLIIWCPYRIANTHLPGFPWEKRCVWSFLQERHTCRGFALLDEVLKHDPRPQTAGSVWTDANIHVHKDKRLETLDWTSFLLY